MFSENWWTHHHKNFLYTTLFRGCFYKIFIDYHVYAHFIIQSFYEFIV